ncbi:unnamed protein product, partial [Ectocarpus sp. 4 AP-2014]
GGAKSTRSSGVGLVLLGCCAVRVLGLFSNQERRELSPPRGGIGGRVGARRSGRTIYNRREGGVAE